MQEVEDYIALALQVECKALNGLSTREEAYEAMEQVVQKLKSRIAASKGFIGPNLKLVVVPEYFLTSFPLQESIEDWKQKCCLRKTDPIFQKIGEICKTFGVFFSGNYYELDDNFPDIFFQASFIIDDQGEMILNYRRLNSMYSPTPHDVLDRYVEIYGYEALFPVVDTKLGKLACVASEEILYPEVTRCLMMRGAEVILHSSSEVGSPLPTKKGIAKQARAIENICYVVSANSAGIVDYPIPASSTDGGSQIVHYDGHVLAEAWPGESIVAHAYIHIEALRRYRNTVSMKNYNARQRFELYAPSYSKTSHYPPNVLMTNNPDKAMFKRLQQETIKKIYQ